MITLLLNGSYASANEVKVPLSITTLAKPIPVPSQHHQIIAYELHFINNSAKPARIGRIEIWNDNKTLLKTLAGSELVAESVVYHPQTGPAKPKHIELQEGMGAFVFVSLELDKDKKLPTELKHKIWVTTVSADQSTANTEQMTYKVAVSTDKPVVLGPPLNGSQWIAEAAFSKTSYHRRAILPIEGQFYLAQRFAIDWVRACSDGLEAHGSLHQNANWQSYGYDLLAVADGTISKLGESNMPDNMPPGLPNPTPPINKASGNYVILHTVQNHKDYYVLYAHMQPGSILVKEGQKVSRGEVIGKLGNTGNSSAPHLHLHVTETNESEKSNGLPFVFDTITLQGEMKPVDEDYGVWLMPEPLSHTKLKHVIPTENQVFFFSNLNRKCP